MILLVFIIENVTDRFIYYFSFFSLSMLIGSSCCDPGHYIDDYSGRVNCFTPGIAEE